MISNALPLSLVNNPLLSQWLAFERPGVVRITTGKVEIGQGILTALTQIAAEELDVEVEQIHLVSGETDSCPAEGFSSGSYSVSVGGGSLRIVCAEARALFLAALADRLGCTTADLAVERGRFLRAGQDCGHDYWSMAANVPLERRALGTTPAKRPADYRIVGRSLPRVDLPAKLRGGGFIHDMAPADCLHARVLRQPWRDAELVALDEAAVHKAAGAPIDILRIGNFVAFTSASEIAVMRAAETARLKARWAAGQQVSDNIGEAAWLKAQPSRDRTVETRGSGQVTAGTPVKADFWRPFLTYGSIGPSCGLAEFADGKLKVWTHCQGPAVLHEWIASALGMTLSDVIVFHRQGAGAYGHNTADDAAFDAAFIATRLPGRTVRVMWSREDEFEAAPVSPAMAIELSAVIGPDGRPSDWTTEIWSPPHAQRPGMNGNSNLLASYALPGAVPRKPIDDVAEDRGGGATRNALPIYDLPRHRLIHHMLPDVPLRTSSLRGLGAWANVYAIECFVDELAEAAGEDSLSYRLSMLSDPRAKRVLETVADMSGWFDKRNSDDGSACGIGFARYKNIAAYCAVIVEATVEETVRLKRIWCAADAGLVINPDGVRNQIEGAIIQGTSFVLRESVRFENGRVATNSWQDYPILRFSDVPVIDIQLVDTPNEPTLGVGECGVGPAGAAIGNAVARALGVRIRKLPLTRENITSQLEQA
jgi:CO/xanthine dehydrogenase Mo-binding subunit